MFAIKKITRGDLASRNLAAERRDVGADTSGLERDRRTCGTGIDEQVYALYGLTPEETCPPPPANLRAGIGRRVKIVEDSLQ